MLFLVSIAAATVGRYVTWNKLGNELRHAAVEPTVGGAISLARLLLGSPVTDFLSRGREKVELFVFTHC